MRLGEWMRAYRKQNNMTMQDMAVACGFSKSYVNMLEKGINPTTNKPVSPTMQIFEKIATATGQDVDTLLRILDDDQPVTINPESIRMTINAEESKLINGYRSLDSNKKQTLFNMLAFLTSPQGATTGSIIQSNNGGNNFLNVGGGTNYVRTI